MENQTTIGGLFSSCDGKIEFSVPAYQRAYSWEAEPHLKQLLADLREQPNGRRYYFGHFLFEAAAKPERSEPNRYLVIDGQQRLTTVVIFFRALCDELAKRDPREVVDQDGEVDIARIVEKYLKYKKTNLIPSTTTTIFSTGWSSPEHQTETHRRHAHSGLSPTPNRTLRTR
jgi:uncharacterized protein with ParB-like and HNH nuclease domain